MAVEKQSSTGLYESYTLNDYVLKIATEELGETAEVRKHCLQLLRKEIIDRKDFNPRAEDDFLLKFLRVAKFSVPKALDKMEKHYRLRVKHPQVFEDMHQAISAETLAKHRTHYVLPHRNADHSAIVVTNIKRTGLLKGASWPNVLHDLRWDAMCIECVTDHAVTQVCGITAIMDLRGLRLQDTLAVTTPTVTRLFTSVLLTYPARYKKIHVINAPSFYIVVYRLISHFLSHKIRNRVVVHPNNDGWKSLHSHISPEILPEEYGGKRGPLDSSIFQKIVLDRKEQFKEDMKYGYLRH